MAGAPALDGKVALIIGASRGIGAETAKAFATNGARVVLASRDSDKLGELAVDLGGPSRARSIVTDISKSEDIAAAIAFAVETFGRLDIAFNNAGVSPPRAE